RREEVIVDLKTWFLFRPTIEPAQVGEEIKLETRSYFHEPARGHYVLARDGNSRLAQSFDNLSYPIRMFTLKRRRDQRRRAYPFGVTGLDVWDRLLSVLFVHLNPSVSEEGSERSSLYMPRGNHIWLGFH